MVFTNDLRQKEMLTSGLNSEEHMNACRELAHWRNQLFIPGAADSTLNLRSWEGRQAAFIDQLSFDISQLSLSKPHSPVLG